MSKYAVFIQGQDRLNGSLYTGRAEVNGEIQSVADLDKLEKDIKKQHKHLKNVVITNVFRLEGSEKK